MRFLLFACALGASCQDSTHDKCACSSGEVCSSDGVTCVPIHDDLPEPDLSVGDANLVDLGALDATTYD